MDIEPEVLPPFEDMEGVNAPPRMSQEINPQNLADLFAEDPACNDKPEASAQVPRALAFAGARIDDEFEMKKLQVFVRIRPTHTENSARLNQNNNYNEPNSTAGKYDAENCIHASSKHTLAIAPPEGSMAYKSGDRGCTFNFSQVFEASTSQEEYFAATAAPLVQDLLRNPQHNSVMMAYGITAAGKTYTIEGNKSAPGVLPRALSSLFIGLEEHMDAESLAVRVSYCEIYNEAVYDLLDESSSATGIAKQRPALRLMEDSRGKVTVSGLSEVEVSSGEEALSVLRRGAKHRQRAETGLNYSSSRSHSIFGIQLVRKQQAAGAGEDGEEERDHEKAVKKVERLGRMSFVDLAGSERAQRTGNVGLRLKESVAINSSLMTLGRCLEALRWNQQQHSTAARTGVAAGPLKVVPYRESKVTHLFRDALHGYGKVVLSVNVSPCARDYDETSHVLRYASLATGISTLQQAEAPRRTIKAVTPGALRRAKRRAAAKAAKEEAAKKAKVAAAEAQELAAKAAAAASAAAAAAALAAEPTPSQFAEPPTTVAKAAADAEMEVDQQPNNASPPAQQQNADQEEEVVYEVMGRRLLSDEFAAAAGPEPVPTEVLEQQEHSDDEFSKPHRPSSFAVVENSGEKCSPEAVEAPEQVVKDGDVNMEAIDNYYSDVEGTPSTPCSNEEDDESEVVAALQAQVQQLIKDLQAAEERSVLLEGEVREEVAAEMAGLLKDMEESYRERLSAEVAAVEARVGGGKGNSRGKKKGKRGKNSSSSSGEEDEEAGERAAAAAAAAQIAAAEEALSKAQAEISALHAELELYEEEARDQAERIAKAEDTARDAQAAAAEAQEQLAAVQARTDSLATALAETRRRSEELVQHRLKEEKTQLEANAAMELEMAEQQAERLRKENMALRQQLAAALATLETVASPSMPLMQRMAAACPPGGGCGAGGTPHEVALARARQAAAAEDALAAAAGGPTSQYGCSTGSLKSRSGSKPRSRFAEEALAAGMPPQTQISQPCVEDKERFDSPQPSDRDFPSIEFEEKEDAVEEVEEGEEQLVDVEEEEEIVVAEQPELDASLEKVEEELHDAEMEAEILEERPVEEESAGDVVLEEAVEAEIAEPVASEEPGLEEIAEEEEIEVEEAPKPIKRRNKKQKTKNSGEEADEKGIKRRKKGKRQSSVDAAEVEKEKGAVDAEILEESAEQNDAVESVEEEAAVAAEEELVVAEQPVAAVEEESPLEDQTEQPLVEEEEPKEEENEVEEVLPKARGGRKGKKPASKRSTRSGKQSRNSSSVADDDDEVAEEQEEAPRRRTGRSRRARPVSLAESEDEDVEEQQEEEEEVVEVKEKPRCRQRSKKKEAEPVAAEQEDDAVVVDEYKEEEEEKPRKRGAGGSAKQRLASKRSRSKATAATGSAENEEPAAAEAAPKGRKRRLLQPSKPLSVEMRSALGDLAQGDVAPPSAGPSFSHFAKKTPGKPGMSLGEALGLSPMKMARYRSPKRTRRQTGSLGPLVE